MENLMFFIRCLVMTVIFVVLLQIHIGKTSIEEQATNIISSSYIIEPIQHVADGATKLIRDIFRKVSGSFKTKFWHSLDAEKSPGSRQMNLDMSRSKAYIEQQTRKAADRIKQEVEGEKPSSTKEEQAQ